MALGVEFEEAGQNFVAEIGGPEEAPLIGVVVFGPFVEVTCVPNLGPFEAGKF
jgi:hypothetical protein